MSAIHPAAVYYHKFGGPIAAISPQKGAAWDGDGLSAISVGFLLISRGSLLVFAPRKVEDWKSIDPRSTPQRGN